MLYENIASVLLVPTRTALKEGGGKGKTNTTWKRTMEGELKAAGVTCGQIQEHTKTEGTGDILCERTV